MRATLLRLAHEDHVLLLTLHHIVSDGWSMGVFYREVSVLYQAFSNAEPSSLPALPIQYADFAIWQREWLPGEVLETQLSYWKKQLRDLCSAITYRSAAASGAELSGPRQYIELSKELTQGLKEFSRKEGVTLLHDSYGSVSNPASSVHGPGRHRGGFSHRESQPTSRLKG